MLMKKYKGSFNKRENLIESKYLEELGFDYEFDEKIYAQVEKDIIAVLGKKEKYLGIDACRYFRERYFAYPIDITRFYDYMSTDNFAFSDGRKVQEDSEIFSLTDELGKKYHYISDVPEREDNITMVIETSCNKALFKKFPEIEKNYKECIERFKLKKDKKGNYYDECGALCRLYGNIILTIGTIDGKSINSIKILYGEDTIKELDYVLCYFREHS